MKKVSYLILLIMTLLLANTNAFAAKQVLFQDNFKKLDPSWGVTTETQKVENNQFIIIPKVDMTHYDINQSGVYQDVDYSVDMTLLKGDGTKAGAGIIFWAKDSNDYYYLYVLADGTFYVGRYINNRFLYPVSSQKSDAIKTTPGAVNHLRVVTKGNQATIYINDKQLATFTGQPPEGGSLIGLSGDSPTKSQDNKPDITNTWGFSNLKVTKPE